MQIHYKSIVFSSVLVKYLFCTPSHSPIKAVVMSRVCMRHADSKLLTCERWREYSDADLPSNSLSPFPPCVHPPLAFFSTISPISACSVVAVSQCMGEACMCILTRAALRFSPPSQQRAPAARSLDFFINRGISTKLLLKLIETDGCCCLQV